MNSTFSNLLFGATLLAFFAISINGLPTTSTIGSGLTAADRAYNAKMVALEQNKKHLIKTSEDQPAGWMSQDDIAQLALHHQGFMDVTFSGDYQKPENQMMEMEELPSEVTQQETAKSIMQLANTDLMKSTLKTLTEFPTRYYLTATGVKSSNWLYQHVQNITAEYRDDQIQVTVRQFNHSNWQQKSLIARIEGSDSPDQVVILGAHQDSVNWRQGWNNTAPGADDDGSGSVTILETFKSLLSAKYHPKKSVEFHWYSGEEAGLLGSQEVAKDYRARNVTVNAMLQLDMTGFPRKTAPADIGLVEDFTDSRLTALLENLVKEYTQLPPKRMKCGYGCSDHASWNRNGYPSAFPFEGSSLRENKQIHSQDDTYETVDFDHALNFVKIAIGFVVELTNQ